MPICLRFPSRLGSFALLLAGSMTLHAQEFSQDKDFDIPPQPLSKAVIQFSDQSGIQVVTAGQDVSKLNTAGVKGRLKIDQALKALLKGTQLSYTVVGNSTVALVNGASSAGSTPSSAQDFRVAQVDHGAAGPSSVDTVKSEDSDSKKKTAGLEEIVVTGTHIAGGAPVGSPLIVISDADIANSGYSTIGDVIRSLPQSFGGGVNPSVVGANGSQNANNISAASTVNLRGLGPDSTLTLVNGHRIAYDGFTNASDISVIPLAAIQRVEILTDSASAVYGSDAVAGVANFILKKDFQGAVSTARVGTSTRGGATEDQFSQLLGTTWASGGALLSYEHYGQRELYSTDRSFSFDAQGPVSIVPYQNRDSVFADVRTGVSDSTSVYLDGLYTDRKSHDVISFGSSANEHRNTTTLYSVTSGLQSAIGHDWNVSLDGDWSASRDQPDYYQLTGGLPGPLQHTFYANRVASIEARVDGPVVSLPSGAVQAAVGGGYRHETFSASSFSTATRGVKYGFAEFRVPLVEPDTGRTAIERLNISISGRYEDYSDAGSTTTPKVGLDYSPIKGVTVRGTWGKAFRAPSLLDLHGGYTLTAGPAIYEGGSGEQQVLNQGGYNSGLQPEKATTWSLGVDYKPEQINGLTTNITYFNINYRNRILAPITNLAVGLSNPIYAPFVQLNPSPATQAALVAGASSFQDYTFLTGAVYDPSKVVANIDNLLQNVARQKIDGVDFGADWRVRAGAAGEFDFIANVAWMELREQLTSTTPQFFLSGVIFNPPKVKARAGGTWQRRAWSASSFLNYAGAETDNSTLTNVPISSWTTLDAQVSYETSPDVGAVGRLKTSISVQNLFDKDPPLIATASTYIPGLRYDSTNASPLGRFVSITITKYW